jgi:hypothetical protein
MKNFLLILFGSVVLTSFWFLATYTLAHYLGKVSLFDSFLVFALQFLILGAFIFIGLKIAKKK